MTNNPNKPKRRSVDKKGRNKHGPSFVKLESWFLRSKAYRSMKALPRAVYTELRRRFNGQNNGYISLSLREIKAELHCSKDSAAKALDELVEKGFIKENLPASFHWKVRHARTWILTEEPFENEAATKEFTSWEPPLKEKSGPKRRTNSPNSGTEDALNDAQSHQNVLYLGSRRANERGSRP